MKPDPRSIQVTVTPRLDTADFVRDLERLGQRLIEAAMWLRESTHPDWVPDAAETPPADHS